MTSTLSVPVICTICRSIFIELVLETRTPGMVSDSSNLNADGYEFLNDIILQLSVCLQQCVHVLL